MLQFIEWTNFNTGFLMANLTAVYVLATIWIVYETRRSNRLAANFEKDRVRPHVVFWVETQQETHGQFFSSISFVGKIRNEGASTAHDVSIITNPKIVARLSTEKGNEGLYYTPSFLEEPTSIIVSKQEIAEIIGPTKFLLEDNNKNNLVFETNIKYKDINGTQYSTSYKIDLSRNREKLFAENEQEKAFFKMVEDIGNSSIALDRINHTLNQPDRSNSFYVNENIDPSPKQLDLFYQIKSLEDQGASTGEQWILNEVIGRTYISQFLKDKEIELDVRIQDIHALIRAGYLQGYYQNNNLWFCVCVSK